PWSPLAIASSTFFTKVRIRLSRDWLISARRSLRRTRFLADLMLGIGNLSCFVNQEGRGYSPASPQRQAGLRPPEEPDQRCFQAGARFSAKALIPSARSSRAKVAWKS